MTNENTNLLRQYVPRGTDVFRQVLAYGCLEKGSQCLCKAAVGELPDEEFD